MTVATPLRGSVRGIPLQLHPPGDFVSDEIRRTGDFYEANILDEVASRFSGGVVVDAGAHIGNHAAFLAAFSDAAAIHAFEPWPANLELLHRNVAMFPRVTVHPVALSNHRSELFMRAEANLGHSRVAQVEESLPESASDWANVEAVTLDSCRLTNVTLLKIDVENHEPQVLAGGVDTIARWRPLILIEDWTGLYGDLLPGYRLVADWGQTHQTYLYGWAS